MRRNLAAVDFNQYPSTQCPTSVKKASFGCGFEEAAPFVVTPSSREATESVIEANLDPDFAPIKQIQMGRFDGERWRLFGPLITGAVNG